MRLSSLSFALALAFVATTGTAADPESSYAPTFVKCPSNLRVRPASKVHCSVDINLYSRALTFRFPAGPFCWRIRVARSPPQKCHTVVEVLSSSRQHQGLRLGPVSRSGERFQCTYRWSCCLWGWNPVWTRRFGFVAGIRRTLRTCKGSRHRWSCSVLDLHDRIEWWRLPFGVFPVSSTALLSTSPELIRI